MKIDPTKSAQKFRIDSRVALDIAIEMAFEQLPEAAFDFLLNCLNVSDLCNIFCM